MIAKEFPDIVKLKTIGKTWNEKPIKLLELDARKYMETLGIQGIKPPSAEEKAKTRVALAKAQEEAEKKIEEMSEEELLEHNEDNTRT
jgi:hypothetical protein